MLPLILSHTKRAHTRLNWHERLIRNRRGSDAAQITIRLFGVPQAFACLLGLMGGERQQASSSSLS